MGKVEPTTAVPANKKIGLRFRRPVFADCHHLFYEGGVAVGGVGGVGLAWLAVVSTMMRAFS